MAHHSTSPQGVGGPKAYQVALIHGEILVWTRRKLHTYPTGVRPLVPGLMSPNQTTVKSSCESVPSSRLGIGRLLSFSNDRNFRLDHQGLGTVEVLPCYTECLALSPGHRLPWARLDGVEVDGVRFWCALEAAGKTSISNCLPRFPHLPVPNPLAICISLFLFTVVFKMTVRPKQKKVLKVGACALYV